MGGEPCTSRSRAWRAPSSSGRITAIDSVVDPATRNVQVQATLGNADGRLHPGMFVEAHVVLAGGGPIVALPASAISYAPYGDSVFVVGRRPGPERPDLPRRAPAVREGRAARAATRSRWSPESKAGEEVVTSGAFKLRNGAAVHVHNEIQPANDPAPKPEDN